MGNFYSNFTLKTSDVDGVAEIMQGASREAMVSPAMQGYVVVYDAETEKQDIELIERVGVMLSKYQKCPVLGVMNHDDDILCYWLFGEGRLIDSYNSAPGYFDDSAGSEQGGDVELLCRTLDKPEAVGRVREILYDESFVFAFQQHEALSQALGLPRWAVVCGYRYLERGYLPEGLEEGKIRRVK